MKRVLKSFVNALARQENLRQKARMVVAVPSAGPSNRHSNCYSLRHLKQGVKFYNVAAMKVRRI